MPPPPITSPKPLRELAQRAVYQHCGILELRANLPKSVITDVISSQPVFRSMGASLDRPGQMRNGCTVKSVVKQASCQSHWWGEMAWSFACCMLPPSIGIGATLGGLHSTAGMAFTACSATGFACAGGLICVPVSAVGFATAECLFYYARDFQTQPTNAYRNCCP